MPLDAHELDAARETALTIAREAGALLLEGWRTALEAMPNATMPASCR